MSLQGRGLTRAVGGRTLFAGLDVEVAEGTTLVVRGPSGVGKSQLLRALAALDPLQAGELRLDGRDLRGWGVPSWRAEVAYVAQQPRVLAPTARAWAGRVARLGVQRRREADDPVALAARWGLPPEAWDRPWGRLSGGEQQRVVLAVAAGRRPRVLLLDEPTSALDPAAREAVEADLRGRTAVWVTHDPSQAERVGDGVLELGT